MTPSPAVKAPRYSVKGNDILRGDEEIATVIQGKVIPLLGFERYHIQASRAWNAVAESPEAPSPAPVVEAQPAPPDDLSAIPPRPAEIPSLGDKTPDVIRWYLRYFPNEFAHRYKGRTFKPLD